jgi:hypothetical protein
MCIKEDTMERIIVTAARHGAYRTGPSGGSRAIGSW